MSILPPDFNASPANWWIEPFPHEAQASFPGLSRRYSRSSGNVLAGKIDRPRSSTGDLPRRAIGVELFFASKRVLAENKGVVNRLLVARAIGGGCSDLLERDVSAGAGLVLHHHRLLQVLLQFLRNGSGSTVSATSSR